MAHIDDLVKQISDPQLRAALAQQVATLTSRKQFGLVFQEHSPESVRLPQQRIRTGDKVELRESKESATFHVISTKASLEVATVIELDESSETVGEPQEMLKTDLVVVKPFGDPVYPGLRQVGEAGIAKPGQPTHVVINGENYHALQALEYTHAGKVDLIYIDPPYNTGAADWKYNDKYIDGSDSYRHSKWLSFMDKRLRIAKSLLKDTGVIVLAIDDNEHHRLRMLADQVFGEQNFLSNITWQGNIKNDAKFSGGGADYMLIYSKDKERLVEFGRTWREKKEGLDQILEAGKHCWNNSKGNPIEATEQMKKWWLTKKSDFSPGLIEYKFIDEEGFVYSKSRTVDFPGGGGPKYDVMHPITGNLIKPPSNGWRASESTMKEWIKEGILIFDESDQKLPTIKRRLVDNDIAAPYPTFKADRRGAANRLSKMLGEKRFPFPKDDLILSRWFRMIAPKDAVIVDFFAGSGTTAESVIRLNAEDGGTRQAILVTNNELAKTEDSALRKRGFIPGDAEYEAMGVFHHVTKPRISTVLTGVREDGSKYSDGIDGQDAAFFDLTYEDENLISLGNKFDAIAPLLWMQAGATGTMIRNVSDVSRGGNGYEVPVDGTYAVIFDTDTAGKAITELHDGIKQVFVVTDSDNDFRAVVAGLPRELQKNAHRLYANYLRSFEINRSH